MDITFADVNKSPVSQDFVWLAEYKNKTSLSEFDFYTKKENNFKDIDKNNISKFGLVGQGIKIYYRNPGGSLYIAGRKYSISIMHDNILYELTYPLSKICDPITYKRAQVTAAFGSVNTGKPEITGYYCGYKKQENIKNVDFMFKPIVKIEAGLPVNLEINIKTNKDMKDARIIILKSDSEKFEYPVSIKANVISKINWKVI